MHAAVSAPRKLHYENLFWITLIHAMAILSFWYFSWANLAVLLLGTFLLSPLGINVGYHRLLTHRAFRVPRWLQRTFAVLGSLAGGGPPLEWVALHRVHHRFSDTERDPHNSNLGFWYSHIGHLFFTNECMEDPGFIQRYAPDLYADGFLRKLNRHWVWIALAALPVLWAVGGFGMVLWGGFLRIALTWHIMWFVNSASHKWGYRNFDTKDNTTNCWWVGLIGAGEGWHNNHHAHPTWAAHGLRWFEFDLSYSVIRALELCGLATQVKGDRRLAEGEESAAPTALIGEELAGALGAGR